MESWLVFFQCICGGILGYAASSKNPALAILAATFLFLFKQ